MKTPTPDTAAAAIADLNAEIASLRKSLSRQKSGHILHGPMLVPDQTELAALRAENEAMKRELHGWPEPEACPRCTPPGDHGCPYCMGTFRLPPPPAVERKKLMELLEAGREETAKLREEREASRAENCQLAAENDALAADVKKLTSDLAPAREDSARLGALLTTPGFDIIAKDVECGGKYLLSRKEIDAALAAARSTGGSAKCRRCEGTGKVALSREPCCTDEITCPDCKGSGNAGGAKP